MTDRIALDGWNGWELDPKTPEASSLGTPEAKALRALTPPEVAAAIVARSKEIGVPSVAQVSAWWLVNDPYPDCPDEFHGADGGRCGTCGWDVAGVGAETGLSAPVAASDAEPVGEDTKAPERLT